MFAAGRLEASLNAYGSAVDATGDSFQRENAADDRPGSEGGTVLPFSDKWPTSDANAKVGIIIRESEDGQSNAAAIRSHPKGGCTQNCLHRQTARESTSPRG